MFCTQCGFQNAAGDGFCGRCGAPLRPAERVTGASPSVPAAPPGLVPTAPAAPMYQPGYAAPPARKTHATGIAMFGIVMLLLGAAAAYVVLKGGIPWPPGQVAMQAYSDPAGHFKIRFPQGWKAFPGDEVTVFSQSDIGSARHFRAAQVASPTVIVFQTEKDDKEITAAQASQEAIGNESGVQILRQRSGTLATASGAAEAMWVDVLFTEPNAQRSVPQTPSKQVRARLLFVVRRPGDGTTIKGGAACLSPPEAFASFERVCSTALDSYEVGNP